MHLKKIVILIYFIFETRNFQIYPVILKSQIGTLIIFFFFYHKKFRYFYISSDIKKILQNVKQNLKFWYKNFEL